MTDLLTHVGGGQRWIEAALGRRATDETEVAWSPPPEQGVLEWFADGIVALVETARGVDHEAPMPMLWNGAGAAADPDFLRRRAANEAAIHRWDAQRAVGDASPIPSELALDCLDELLTRWLPWAAATGRQAQGPWSGESIALRSAGRTWTVTFVATGSVRVDTCDRAGAVTASVEGQPSSMALFAMNRAETDEAGLHVDGDEAVVSRWRAEVRFGSRTPAPSTER